MLKIKFHGSEVTLLGDQIKEGQLLNFVATKADFSDVDLKSFPGSKVLSIVPSIDTSVCSEQTTKLAQIAKEYPDVTFITISMDLPVAQSRWCSAHRLENTNILSDYKDHSFAKSSNLLIDELKLLARALIIVDDQNIVKYVAINEEVTQLPNFIELENKLKQLKSGK